MASYIYPGCDSSESSRSPSPSRGSSNTTISQRPSLSSLSSRCASSFAVTPVLDLGMAEVGVKMSSLDVINRFHANSCPPIKRLSSSEHIQKSKTCGGIQLLREPAKNKGTSFSPEERASKNLNGLIPHVLETMDMQCQRAMRMIQSRSTNIDKYLYLSSIKASNIHLFFRILMDHVSILMPLIYTPTIGDVCLQYSTLYTRPEALYISIKQRKSISNILRNWPHSDPSICVVTDGSRVLGLGDLGVNGVGISIGKLSLYTAAAGIHPDKTLPVVLDCGTTNEDNLKDPLYLGLRQKRVSSQVAQEFMDEFMSAVIEVYPNMLVQFEDFETEKAFRYLERYRVNKCFNDDIQGTGAVVLAGYISAVRLSNVPLEDQKLVFMGAGSAGVGVAKQLMEYYIRHGLSERDAKDKIYLVDTKGLITTDRGDQLNEYKRIFARSDNNGRQLQSLEEIILEVKATALIGLTATYGTFTESIVKALKDSVEASGADRRCILFPLSNPLSKAECTFEQAIKWTDGTVIFASGSPFTPYTLQFNNHNTTFYPNQGNNVYIFPGLGLGAILAKTKCVTDSMVYTAAAALSGCLNEEEIRMGLIYPRIERVREASIVVAREVMKCSHKEGVSMLPEKMWAEWDEWGDVALTAWIKQQTYDPKW